VNHDSSIDPDAEPTQLHPAVIEAFLTIMRQKRPDLIWSIKPPASADQSADSGATDG
jgi:hypothetical protein